MYNIKLKYKWGFQRWRNFVDTNKAEKEIGNKQKRINLYLIKDGFLKL